MSHRTRSDRRAVARRGRGALAAALVLGIVLTGCGGSAGGDEATDEVPVAEAVPVPFGDAGLAPPVSPPPADEADAAASGPADDVSAAPSPTPSPTRTVGPTSADAAAFVASDALADLSGLEHVVVDLDGDTWVEVVATGIRDRVGVVRVAWWSADGFTVLAETVAGPGRDVADLRAADVNEDGRTELLVAIEGEGRASLAVWSVPGRGQVAPLEARGGCHDGTHVYGVTRARLVDQGDAPPAIVADCDDSPLPVADWAEQRWVWDGRAYVVVEETLPAPPSASEVGDDEGDDDDEDGEGDGD